MDRPGPLVFAQSQQDRLPHAAIGRPFLEPHFAYQFWRDPLDRRVDLRPRLERTGLLNQGVKFRAQLGQLSVVRAPAGVADIDEVGPLVDPEHHRAEMLPRAARRGESSDHGFLAIVRLDLEPLGGAAALAVGTGRVLGHDPLQPVLHGRPKEVDAAIHHAFAEHDIRHALENGTE